MDVFLKIPMEERVVDVELTRRPAARSSNGEHGVYSSWFNHRREGFAEVNASTLCEATDNPSCFIALEGAIRIEFMAENPFTGDDMGTGRAIDQAPCAVSPKSAKLLLYGAVPVRVPECGARRGW